MAMGFKKKKNVFILSLLVGICFILYQLYFFVAISTITSNDRIIHVVDHSNFEELVVHSEEDKNVNLNGVIRGVLLINMPHYRMDSNNNFKCLTLEQFIPFHQVNDDYCDCEDSSDEPSTTACINGTFYCDTQYKSKTINSIPSNRINDGICDCCDGSDEWVHNNRKILLTQGSVKLKRHYSTKCPNLC